MLTCQGRAAAPDLADPTAMVLLRPDERTVVHRVQAGEVPPGFGDRLEYEQVRACGEVMLPRTLAIDAAVAALAELSAPGSRLVANYEAPSALARAGRLLASALTALAGRRAVTADEPRRSAWTPAALGALVAGHGLGVTQDRDLATAAADLGLRPDARAYLSSSRVLVADRR